MQYPFDHFSYALLIEFNVPKDVTKGCDVLFPRSTIERVNQPLMKEPFIDRHSAQL